MVHRSLAPSRFSARSRARSRANLRARPGARQRARSSLLWGSILLIAASGCGGAATGEAAWPDGARQWYERADASYRHGDIEDAAEASEQALRALPDEPKVRLLAAHVALARLELDRAVQLTQGMNDSEARGVRARAHWYAGRVEQAAAELDALLADPSVRDPWAQGVAKLARRGRGRRPFEIGGGLVAALDMPRIGNTTLLVPVEVNGEPSLAMIATDTAETVVDTSAGGEGGWVSLRFAERIEVSDVPAIGKDLSGLSRQLNAPIKLLIGVQLLRQLHATVDFAAGQFVVRSFEPPPPPQATTVHPGYVRGGAMVLPASFSAESEGARASLLVHTTMAYPVALDEGGWEKAGVDVNGFSALPGQSGVKMGRLPMLRLGAFEIPNVPGILGAPIHEVEKSLGVELDGFAGSGLVATFRVTFADGGRTVWLEDLPPEVLEQEANARARQAEERAAARAEAEAAAAAEAAEAAGADRPSPTTAPAAQPAQATGDGR